MAVATRTPTSSSTSWSAPLNTGIKFPSAPDAQRGGDGGTLARGDVFLLEELPRRSWSLMAVYDDRPEHGHPRVRNARSENMGMLPGALFALAVLTALAALASALGYFTPANTPTVNTPAVVRVRPCGSRRCPQWRHQPDRRSSLSKPFCWIHAPTVCQRTAANRGCSWTRLSVEPSSSPHVLSLGHYRKPLRPAFAYPRAVSVGPAHREINSFPPRPDLPNNHAVETDDGGGGWIRTSVGVANGFTVRPL